MKLQTHLAEYVFDCFSSLPNNHADTCSDFTTRLRPVLLKVSKTQSHNFHEKKLNELNCINNGSSDSELLPLHQNFLSVNPRLDIVIDMNFVPAALADCHYSQTHQVGKLCNVIVEKTFP